jgi:hypothetical protein
MECLFVIRRKLANGLACKVLHEKDSLAKFRLLLSTLVSAATFTTFTPVTGILKGNASSPVTTATTSTDVIGLWTGTCTGTNYLGADGACHAIAASGTVTSVALTAPSIFSISGSPVTTSGTLNFAYNGAQGDILYASGATTLAALAKNTSSTRYLSNTGTTNNPAWAQIDLTTGVTGILPTANGGTANAFFTVSGPSASAKTFTFPNASSTVLTSNAAVTVAQGGTGVATLTSHGVLLGQGTSNVTALLMGGDTVLRGTASADPVATSVPNCGSSTQALAYSTSTHTFSCQTISAGSPSFPLLAPVGSGGAPSYSFTGNATSGMWNANPGLEIIDPTNIDLASSGTITIAATSGTTVGSPTGGAQGNATVNAEGLFVNGVHVLTNDSSCVGCIKVAVKNSDTTRTSTTTLAADPDLVMSGLTSGRYSFHIYISGAFGGSTQGIKLTVTNSGGSVYDYMCTATQNTANPNAAPTSNDDSSLEMDLASVAAHASMKVICDGAFTGTSVEFRWAQNTSSGTGSKVQAGSYMVVTRLL